MNWARYFYSGINLKSFLYSDYNVHFLKEKIDNKKTLKKIKMIDKLTPKRRIFLVFWCFFVDRYFTKLVCCCIFLKLIMAYLEWNA